MSFKDSHEGSSISVIDYRIIAVIAHITDTHSRQLCETREWKKKRENYKKNNSHKLHPHNKFMGFAFASPPSRLLLGAAYFLGLRSLGARRKLNKYFWHTVERFLRWFLLNSFRIYNML